MASVRSKPKSLSQLKYTKQSLSISHGLSISSDTHFKAFDSSTDLSSPKGLKALGHSRIRVSWGDRSVREQRVDALDEVLRRCANSIRKEDEKVKKELERDQLRVEAVLKDVTKPEREKFYRYNAQSRRKFLSNQSYLSRDEVRRLIAENRMKQKQARHVALIA